MKIKCIHRVMTKQENEPSFFGIIFVTLAFKNQIICYGPLYLYVKVPETV